MMEAIRFFSQMTQGCAELSRIPLLHYHTHPRKLIYEIDKVKLYHYQALVKKKSTTPLLVVFATVNRPEILDLFPEHSFIGGLLQQGMDVYLLDWGYPRIEDRLISISDYVARYLDACVQHIIQQASCAAINLLGICQGGVICLCYAALYPTLKNLVLISTPVDFSTRDNMIAPFFKKLQVDDWVSLMGNIPGAWLSHFFISLRPFELIGKKYLRFVDQINDKEKTQHFLQVEKWLSDVPDQTGASFSELIKECYQQNKLIKGEMVLNHQRVDLTRVTLPVLNVMAKQDEIVPVSASRPLEKCLGSSDYSSLYFDSGHIGIYISDKVGKRMPQAIANWLWQRD